MAEEQTAKFILEKFKFGELNPIGQGTTLSAPDLFTPNSAMQTIRTATQEFFKTEAFKGTGPYKGIVLRIDTAPAAGNPAQASQAGSWFGNFLSSVSDGAGLTQNVAVLTRVRVRIPELHAALPIPRSLPDPTAESPDHAIIDMYPQFLAETTATMAPAQAGDLVWVDFGNRDTFEDPIYIAPVENGIAVYNGGVAPPSASDSFGESSPGNIPGGGTEVEQMFKKYANGNVLIRRALGQSRWDTFFPALQNYLNQKFPGENWVVTKGGGTKRELHKAAKTKVKLRASGSLHGAGLAFDSKMYSDKYPWPINPKDGKPSGPAKQNRILLKNDAFLTAVNDFVNNSGDVRWGAYIEKGSKKSAKMYFEKRKGKDRIMRDGELHHFQITEKAIPNYYAPWKAAMAKLGISRTPISTSQHAVFYGKVLQYFGV